MVLSEHSLLSQVVKSIQIQFRVSNDQRAENQEVRQLEMKDKSEFDRKRPSDISNQNKGTGGRKGVDE